MRSNDDNDWPVMRHTVHYTILAQLSIRWRNASLGRQSELCDLGCNSHCAINNLEQDIRQHTLGLSQHFIPVRSINQVPALPWLNNNNNSVLLDAGHKDISASWSIIRR